jgi:hypothetical protein
MTTTTKVPGLLPTARERSVLRKRAIFDAIGEPELLNGLLEDDELDPEAIHAKAEVIADYIAFMDGIGWQDNGDCDLHVDLILWGDATRRTLERLEEAVRSETADDFRISQETFTRAAELLAGEVDQPDDNGQRDVGDELLEQLWVIRMVRARIEEVA